MRATTPYQFNLKDAEEIWSHIECPTLLIPWRCESWTGDWEKDGRTKVFKSAEIVTIEKAGHWVHHDQLDESLKTIKRFLQI